MKFGHGFFLSKPLTSLSRGSGSLWLYEIGGEAAQAGRCAVTSPEGTGDLYCLQGQKEIWLCLWGNALQKAPVTVPKRNLRDRGQHGIQPDYP